MDSIDRFENMAQKGAEELSKTSGLPVWRFYEMAEEGGNQLVNDQEGTEYIIEGFIQENRAAVLAVLSDIVDASPKDFGAEEMARLGGYCGFIKPFKERVGAIILAKEIQSRGRDALARKRCQKYERTDFAFGAYPELNAFNWNDELIRMGEGMTMLNGALFLKNGSVGLTLDPAVPEDFVHSFAHRVPNAKVYVRILKEQKLKRLLKEAVLRPSNPNWFQNLSLFKGRDEASGYALQPLNDAMNKMDEHMSERMKAEIKEYHISGARRLDVLWKRDRKGNLSGFAEEIFEVGPNQYESLAIHCDTDAKEGTDWKKATLNHLDLAYTLYSGDNAKIRMEANAGDIQEGKESTARTHLFRADGKDIPLAEFFTLAGFAFRSTALKQDWLEDSKNKASGR